MFDDFVIVASAMKLLYAFVAVIGAILVSSWLDHRARRPFADTAATILRSSLAAGLYYGLRFVGICILVGMVIGCSTTRAGPLIPDRYDREIARAVETWWPDYPFPSAWKAQLYQESRLDPAAVSPAGARGLAQFIPATWQQVARELRSPVASPHRDIAIEWGAYYMARHCRAPWRAGLRSADDRQRLAQASYNAGLGNILAAQARCNGPPDWAGIAACLPAVTGRHADETLAYVARIARWRAIIERGG